MATQARADWFVNELALVEGDDDDPFEVPVQEVGKPIDLSDRHAVLSARLTELLRREGNCFAAGITCAIRDTEGTSCNSCPVSKSHLSAEPVGRLCRIGKEQEQVVTSLAAMAEDERVAAALDERQSN